MKHLYFLFFIILIFPLADHCADAQIIHVPDDYTNIQDAINASDDADTVLVAPGEYFENLNMHGKNILLASHFIIGGDLEHINNTIINGSRPAHPDTASCILIVSGENENCVVAGFTITGGTGTRWEDEHGPGNFFTEGGGLLLQASSPTIRNNVIRDNEALTKNSRNLSAGGGGIRSGDGNPLIINNFIHHNMGRYGAGIVLNFSGAVIKNNIISSNTGGADFGGAGIWLYGNADNPRIIENNTIVSNLSYDLGGGIRIWSSSAVLTNNIVRGNHARSGAQIHGSGTISYCNVEGGMPGEGNIDTPVSFIYPLLFLEDSDPSIDAGNPHASFDDPEDPGNPGIPLFPAKGTLRNDLGAYGGPGAQQFPTPDFSGINLASIDNQPEFKIYPNPASDVITIVVSTSLKGPAHLEIINTLGQTIAHYQFTETDEPFTLSIRENNIQCGLYFIKLISNQSEMVDRLVVR